MSSSASIPSVLITGASTGIGKACALHFDSLGCLVFACVRKEEDAAALKAAASGSFKTLMMDVTDPPMISAAADEAAEYLGGSGLSGLVNNAGIPLGAPLEFLSIPDFRYEIEVNLIGALAVTQAFLPLIRMTPGRIINISSASGFIALPFMGPYAATKFGLRAISDSLRVELRPWDIKVSILEVGDVDTQIWPKSLEVMEKAAGEAPEAAMDLYRPIMGLRERFKPHGISPDEVARVVEHALTSSRPKARYVVGRDARFLDLVRRLPTSIRDRLIASQLPEYG